MSSCSTWTTSEPEPFGDRSLPTATSRTTNELCQGGDHVEHELAAWGGGVDRLLQAAEPDAALGEPVMVSTRCGASGRGGRVSRRPGCRRAQLVQELLGGRAFALVLFPVLVFLGLSTFERVLQVSIEDLALGIRINRIRRFYLEAAPGLRGWLAPAPTADTFEAAVRSLGLKPRPGQVLLTVAGTISIVNSALAGVWVGMAVSFLPGPAVVPAVVGLAAMVGAALGQHRYQLRRRQAAPAPFALDDADGGHPRNTP
jgi:hypothetical protein